VEALFGFIAGMVIVCAFVELVHDSIARIFS
jgi:hypothetical protein